ncbi:MAG TPA: hypothetical protein VMZ28_12185 [Kofleriaceae bacterium]|nr:hypothetical protein [Kofleriaceae bacterium]
MRLPIPTLVAVALFALPGCYSTSVRSGATPAGPVHEDRQWFTLAGAVEMSDAGGDECGSAGIARADSRLAGMDILINVGLVVAGASAGLAVCDKDGDEEAYASCVSAMASVPPLLIASRTVSYQCAAGPTAMTPVPGGRPANW